MSPPIIKDVTYISRHSGLNETLPLSDSSVSSREDSDPPVIIPCYNGKPVKLDLDLVINGLAAISIKHYGGTCKQPEYKTHNSYDSNASVEAYSKNRKKKSEEKAKVKSTEQHRLSERETIRNSYEYYKHILEEMPFKKPECLDNSIKQRNSFWNIHRPELAKLMWPQTYISHGTLQEFFHYHLVKHGKFCKALHDKHNRSSIFNEEVQDFEKLREIVPPRILPPDEKSMDPREKQRSIELTDEDLTAENTVHKAQAEFCVTIGEYVYRPNMRRSRVNSNPMRRPAPQNSSCRFVSLPTETLINKDVKRQDRTSTEITCTNYTKSTSSVDDQKEEEEERKTIIQL